MTAPIAASPIRVAIIDDDSGLVAGQKLEQLSPDWRYVHTHFGVGYRFAAERVGGEPAAPESAVKEAVADQPEQPLHTPAGHPAYA